MLLNPEIKTAKQSREMLETLIAEHPSDFNNYLNSIDSADDYQLNNNIHEVHDVHDDKTEIDQLFEKIRIESQSVISEGKKTNFFYLPKLVDQLLRIGKDFPLRTAVCIPFYTDHPTTSYCKKTFT